MPKILVVDDSETIRVSCRRMLTAAGYDVIAACDGFQALERIQENPALIILDINMPGMDGYAVCEQLQTIPTALPIIFLTSEESAALKMLGEAYGAYLHKPISQEKLIAAVDQQLAQTHG
ncbi:MAG: CheY-like chemotaxis protein [Mariniblastus sp.]